MSYPVHRPRRLRRTEAVRRLVRETRLSPEQLIAPLFVCEGEGVRREIPAMPGCFQMSVDALVDECRELAALGVAGVILFGIPDDKHPDGHAAADPAGRDDSRLWVAATPSRPPPRGRGVNRL